MSLQKNKPFMVFAYTMCILFFLSTDAVFEGSFGFDFDFINQNLLFTYKISKENPSEQEIEPSLLKGVTFPLARIINYNFFPSSVFLEPQVSKKITENTTASCKIPLQFFAQIYSIGLKLSAERQNETDSLITECSYNVQGLYSQNPKYFSTDISMALGKKNKNLLAAATSKIELSGITKKYILPQDWVHFDTSLFTYGLYKDFGVGAQVRYSGIINNPKESGTYNAHIMPVTLPQSSKEEHPFVYGVKTAAFKFAAMEGLYLIKYGPPKLVHLDDMENCDVEKQERDLRKELKYLKNKNRKQRYE